MLPSCIYAAVQCTVYVRMYAITTGAGHTSRAHSMCTDDV